MHVALLLAGTLAFQTAVAGELFDFRSESGRFRIGFPGSEPQHRKMSAQKFQLTTNNSQHHTEVDQARYAVEIHDIPHTAALLLTDDFVLEQAKQGMLDDIGGRELTSKAVKRHNQPARRVSFEVPERGLLGELLLVLAKRRLYLVTSLHPAQTEPPVPFNTYADSFEFWLD